MLCCYLAGGYLWPSLGKEHRVVWSIQLQMQLYLTTCIMLADEVVSIHLWLSQVYTHLQTYWVAPVDKTIPIHWTLTCSST